MTKRGNAYFSDSYVLQTTWPWWPVKRLSLFSGNLNRIVSRVIFWNIATNFSALLSHSKNHANHRFCGELSTTQIKVFSTGVPHIGGGVATLRYARSYLNSVKQKNKIRLIILITISYIVIFFSMQLGRRRKLFYYFSKNCIISFI